MRIVSHQPNTSIEFEALPELSSISFQIAAILAGRKVSYGDITLLKTQEFLGALEQILSSGSGEATLEGSYDFRLTVRAEKDKRSTIFFYLAEYIAAAVKPATEFMRLSLQGSFSVASDDTQKMLDDFKIMLAGNGNA